LGFVIASAAAMANLPLLDPQTILDPIEREASSMTKFIASAKKFIKSEDAPTMVEYGLLVALIAIVVAAAAKVLGTNVSSLFAAVASSV
jgi:pilus assembly protein Flp/PilA